MKSEIKCAYLYFLPEYSTKEWQYWMVFGKYLPNEKFNEMREKYGRCIKLDND